jgi:hypothetical protein
LCIQSKRAGVRVVHTPFPRAQRAAKSVQPCCDTPTNPRCVLLPTPTQEVVGFAHHFFYNQTEARSDRSSQTRTHVRMHRHTLTTCSSALCVAERGRDRNATSCCRWCGGAAQSWGSKCARCIRASDPVRGWWSCSRGRGCDRHCLWRHGVEADYRGFEVSGWGCTASV